jgi:DnaK suppressor protein
MLLDRRREMQNDVNGRVRDSRSDRSNEVRDDLEASDANIQNDIEIALLQMRAETLVRVDAALIRLNAGKYGLCASCEAEIPWPRLRALPFAVRCQACEERREQSQGYARRVAQSRGAFSLFPELVRS